MTKSWNHRWLRSRVPQPKVYNTPSEKRTYTWRLEHLCSVRNCDALWIHEVEFAYVTGAAGRVSYRRRHLCHEHGHRWAKKHGVPLGSGISYQKALEDGGPMPLCMDACDANDDGAADGADVSYMLSALFQGGPDPAEPFPDCGVDPSEDSLSCEAHAPCE